MIPQKQQDPPERNSKEWAELTNAAEAIEMQEAREMVMMGTMDMAEADDDWIPGVSWPTPLEDHDDRDPNWRKFFNDLGPQRVRKLRSYWPYHLNDTGFDEPNLRRWLKGEDLSLAEVVPTLAEHVRRDAKQEFEWLKTPYNMITIVTLVAGSASLCILGILLPKFSFSQWNGTSEQLRDTCIFLLALAGLIGIVMTACTRYRRFLDSLTPKADESIQQSKFATRFWFEFTRDMVYAMDAQMAIFSMKLQSILLRAVFFILFISFGSPLMISSVVQTKHIILCVLYFCLFIAEFAILNIIIVSDAVMHPRNKQNNRVFVSASELLYVRRCYGPNGGIEKAESDFIMEKLQANWIARLFIVWSSSFIVNNKERQGFNSTFMRSLRIECEFGFDPLPNDILEQWQDEFRFKDMP